MTSAYGSGCVLDYSLFETGCDHSPALFSRSPRTTSNVALPSLVSRASRRP